MDTQMHREGTTEDWYGVPCQSTVCEYMRGLQQTAGGGSSENQWGRINRIQVTQEQMTPTPSAPSTQSYRAGGGRAQHRLFRK